MDKKWYLSKTLWVNIIGGLASASTAFGFDLGLTPENQVAVVGGVMAIINIVLRIVTTGGVTT